MSSEDWARAFARQAKSDFEARDQLLLRKDLPQCHQLHYLQMAMEKTAKAHLIDRGATPASLQSSHAYIATVAPIIVRENMLRTKGANAIWIIKAVRKLARQIQLLHPQLDDDGSVPSNCEYPWETAYKIVAPIDHDFAFNLDQPMVRMIKEVRARAEELAR